MPAVDLALLRRLENTFYSDLARRVERDYGLLYYEPANPLSHDANHAVILNLDTDLNAATDDVAAFYVRQGLEPRIYSAFLPGDAAVLRPVLEARGFTFHVQALRWFVWDERQPRVAPPYLPSLTIRRETALTRGLCELIHSDGPAPWSESTLRRHLSCTSLHLLVGRVDGIPVTMASLKVMDGLSRVDDVLTHPNHRRRGYARALMAELVGYHRRLSAQPLYLYAENPVAVRIYESVGFREQPLPVDQWSAWKPTGHSRAGS